MVRDLTNYTNHRNHDDAHFLLQGCELEPIIGEFVKTKTFYNSIITSMVGTFGLIIVLVLYHMENWGTINWLNNYICI